MNSEVKKFKQDCKSKYYTDKYDFKTTLKLPLKFTSRNSNEEVHFPRQLIYN